MISTIFSGRTKEYFSNPEKWGLMLTYKQTGREVEALDSGCLWMLDNGAFSGKFDFCQWEKRIRKFSRYPETCMGVILPDCVVFDSCGNFAGGDWKKTLDMAHYYAPIVKSAGLPIAYALQNDHDPDLIPWELFDTLFVGCGNHYKFSGKVRSIALEARRRGKRVHHGRVSGKRKINIISDYTDSIDTTAAIFGDGRARQIEKWITLSACASQPIMI